MKNQGTKDISITIGGSKVSSKNGASAMAARAARFFIRHPGEWYYDQLQIEAWIKGRSLSDEACILLCSSLMKREEYRNKMLDDLAKKRGINREELIDQILKGTAKPMSRKDVQGDEEDDEE